MPYLQPSHPWHSNFHPSTNSASSRLVFQPSEPSTELAPLVVHTPFRDPEPLPGTEDPTEGNDTSHNGPSYAEDLTGGNDTSHTGPSYTEDPTEDNDTSRTATHDLDQSHSSYTLSANPRLWLDSNRADLPLLPEEAPLVLHTDPWLSSVIGKRLSQGWKMVDGDKCPTENCHQNSLVQLANKKECVVCGISYETDVGWVGDDTRSSTPPTDFSDLGSGLPDLYSFKTSFIEPAFIDSRSFNPNSSCFVSSNLPPRATVLQVRKKVYEREFKTSFIKPAFINSRSFNENSSCFVSSDLPPRAPVLQVRKKVYERDGQTPGVVVGVPRFEDKSPHTPIVTSYRDYFNQGQHAEIINNNNIPNQYNSSYPLEELKKHCSPSAAFDSAARFNPPQCAKSTRLRIIQTIEKWINTDEDEATASSLFWLHGGAGVGKSALAQSLSEKFQGMSDQLAASFFFFRSDPTRNNGEQLIPTLVSHLVCTFEGIVPFVEERICKDRALFTKRYQSQIQQLLVEPLLALQSSGSPVTVPRLIVIDGLDECEDTEVQCELLRVIARAMPQIPFPLRFFVTSRPEAHIMRVFSHDRDLQAVPVHRFNLSDDPDADMDIRKFLDEEFAEIRRVHHVGLQLPHNWPNQTAVTTLVERSSGHFVYASTAIRYIRCPEHRPDERLQVILGLRRLQEGDRPYDQLDALYALIFQGVKNYSRLQKICLVLGILYLQSITLGLFSCDITMEELLEMQAGDLVLLLDPILSLVAIDGNHVRILHKSLMDYLLDLRGERLPFDLALVHEVAATNILKQRILKHVYTEKDFYFFALHCQYAHLSDTLKNYLHSLEVPCPRQILEDTSCSVVTRNAYLKMATWHFFRALNREDLDSTGRVYELYMGKWLVGGWQDVFKRRLDKLLSPLKPKTRVAVSKEDDLHCKLETMLTKWNPPSFKPMEGGRDSIKRDACIKREHNILSSYTKALNLGNTNEIASSIVIGGDFLHSYDIAVQDDNSSFILRTYHRHSNICYQRGYFGTLDVVQKTQEYLKMVEKYLISDLCQKYGLNLDET